MQQWKEFFAGKMVCAKRTNVIESFPPEKKQYWFVKLKLLSKMYIASLSNAFVFNMVLIIISLKFKV
jgi:hypothetical protein